MSLLFRALFWFGAYLALVLGPLAAAGLAAPPADGRGFLVELSVAAGFVAFGLLTVELALVARLRPASEPFGTDVLMLVHRWMGIAALGFAALHPLLLLGRGVELGSFLPWAGGAAAQSGAVALWATVLLVASSLVRRRLGVRYALWRALHVVLAVTIVAASVGHARAVAGYAGDPLVGGVVHAFGLGFLALFAWYRLVRPLVLLRRPWEVVANRDEGADVRTLVLRPVGHAGFAFQPGQFAWLSTGRSPFALDDHPISFSSSAELGPDRSVELSIKALGRWSRDVVPRLAPGARARLDGPFGAFTPDRAPAQGFVLIAGGIGITPMRSILLTLRDRGDPRPVLLIHAAHDASRAPFESELRALAQEIPLEIVRVHEAPFSGDDAEQGYVTLDLLRRRLPRDAARRAFFVCGPAPMMDALEEALATLGVAPDQIHTERFDMV